MSYRILISRALAVALIAGLAGKVFACGGSYGMNCAIGDDEQLLRSPRSGFLVELRRVLPELHTRFKAKSPSPPYGPSSGMITQESGVADLKAMIKTAQIPESRRDKIVKSYLTVREHLRNYQEALRSHRYRLKWMSEAERKQAMLPKFKSPEIPSGLPQEFELYLRGAIAWHEGDVEAARQQWQVVLLLPAEERNYRSVWAAYMLGRSYVGADAGKAVKWFVLTRELASGGFVDSTGLAAASFGWEGRVELDRDDHLAAIRLYVEQLATGDNSAAASLRICATRILKSGEKQLDEAARDELGRGIVTAHLVAGPSPLWIASETSGREQVQAWLEVLERAKIRDLRGAPRLGMAAYRTGLMSEARGWVDRAPKDDVIACWIRAKLLLRFGKLDEAAGQLAVALEARAPSEEDEQRWEYRARLLGKDLAALHLTQREYVDALDLLRTHDHSSAAAYLAERILTIDELTAYIDARGRNPRADWFCGTLARRLVRKGRWKDARKYFVPDMRKRLDAYIAAIRKGHDHKTSKADRAESFWAAAQLAQKFGRELMGYDTARYNSRLDGTFRSWAEFSRVTNNEWTSFTIAPASEDEQQRIARHRPESVERWHYLYEAIDHAWRACELMPDNDEQTARRLWKAGTWIKYLDPQAADPFYKALVLRCGNTDLGKAAARLRWLPRKDIDPEKQGRLRAERQ